MLKCDLGIDIRRPVCYVARQTPHVDLFHEGGCGHERSGSAGGKEPAAERPRPYRQLAERHHQLDDRLHELTERHYLSDSEQVEESHPQETQTRREGSDGTDRARVRDGHGRLVLNRPGALNSSAVDRAGSASPTHGKLTRSPLCMRIDPAGWPFVLGGLVLAIVAAVHGRHPLRRRRCSG